MEADRSKGGKVFCSSIQELGNNTGPGSTYPLEERSSNTEKLRNAWERVSGWISAFVGAFSLFQGTALPMHEEMCKVHTGDALLAAWAGIHAAKLLIYGYFFLTRQ